MGDCMTEILIEEWVHACGGLNKNILYWFIMSQTHFGMSRGAKMSLALNEAK